jgi:hypothetical protein
MEDRLIKTLSPLDSFALTASFLQMKMQTLGQLTLRNQSDEPTKARSTLVGSNPSAGSIDKAFVSSHLFQNSRELARQSHSLPEIPIHNLVALF